ncbi:MAG: DNA polymerase III subunit delta [Clostridia bacterium]
MTPEKLEQELKQGKLNSIYLLYGEEEYLLENAVKKIKKLFGDMLLGINYIQIDETNIGSLISEIQMPSFGYNKKLIVVKNSGLFKKSKTGGRKSSKTDNSLQNTIATFIEENIELINEAVILIFIEDEIDAGNTLSKIIEKNGLVCNFEKLKPAQIATRLKSICKAYKVSIDDKTLQEFIETCGTSMQVLINEIRKLIEYAGENGTITKEAITLLSIKELDSVIFDLTDSLGKKNITNALEILHELIYNKEPIQKILVTLYGHFKKIYLTKLAIEYNKNIVEALKLKPNQTFLANKYRQQAEYFSKNNLRKILQELIDLDYNYKQGNIDINVGLEAILCTYCG